MDKMTEETFEYPVQFIVWHTKEYGYDPAAISISVQQNEWSWQRWLGWQAATAESQQQLAGLQLLNQQYREALQVVVNNGYYFNFNKVDEALATTSPTNALDSYVAELKVRYRDEVLEEASDELRYLTFYDAAKELRRMKKGE